MKKNLLLFAVLMMAFLSKSNACSWYEADADYYNLFAQEIMNDPRYRPFLLTLDSRYYTNEVMRNGNIEEWQDYLGLSYDDTRYLVFESSRDDLRNLTKGKPALDKNLKFATPEFARKHKQALLYLAYCKYLEPYMHIVPSESGEYDYWLIDDNYEHNAGELEYDKVKTVLAKSWNAESDKELKLRYGYQLVRLAHYTRRYKEAVQLFDTYVKPLGLYTEMYYYALSQKAGALRGMGRTEEANRDFVKVFANSVDLKTNAYTSMTLGWDEVSFTDFIAGAADDNERNEIYFLMGYGEFNNPTNEMAKIVANDPDAIQAKVLMVRAINMLERNLLVSYYPEEEKNVDNVYPMIHSYNAEELKPFLSQTIAICDQQCSQASDKDFWNLASSYLHFLNKDFDKASGAIGKVNPKEEPYITMVRDINTYIDICSQKRLTPEVENRLYATYGSTMTDQPFVLDVLENRYELQSDRAKAFLVHHQLRDIEYDPQESLIDEVQRFLNKKKKTPLEQYFVDARTISPEDSENYIAYVKGVLRLTDGNFKAAKSFFDKQGRLTVSNRIFGHNIRVKFFENEKTVMLDDYISEFPFLTGKMSESEVTDALMQLQKIGEKKDGDYSAKAYYLMANFYYNVSQTGYFRHYLRFDNNNAWHYDKFSFDNTTYKNTVPLSNEYLAKAKKLAVDPELKAHIVFAAAKNAQQDLEREGGHYLGTVSDAEFGEFAQYSQTSYYDKVFTNCVYYDDYRN